MVRIAVVDALVVEGERLIEAINRGKMKVDVAFWAWQTDGGKWYLHIASPFVNENGSTTAYGEINQAMEAASIRWIDPFQIKAMRTDDSLVEAVTSRLPAAIPSMLGMLALDDYTLGGYEFDEVLIYPPRQPLASS